MDCVTNETKTVRNASSLNCMLVPLHIYSDRFFPFALWQPSNRLSFYTYRFKTSISCYSVSWVRISAKGRAFSCCICARAFLNGTTKVRGKIIYVGKSIRTWKGSRNEKVGPEWHHGIRTGTEIPWGSSDRAWRRHAMWLTFLNSLQMSSQEPENQRKPLKAWNGRLCPRY